LRDIIFRAKDLRFLMLVGFGVSTGLSSMLSRSGIGFSTTVEVSDEIDMNLMIKSVGVGSNRDTIVLVLDDN